MAHEQPPVRGTAHDCGGGGGGWGAYPGIGGPRREHSAGSGIGASRETWRFERPLASRAKGRFLRAALARGASP
jgi:hypothetical protein